MARRDDKEDLPPPPPPGDWVEEGLCGPLLRDDKYEWFPEEDEWNRPEVHRARATCNRCPVRADCAKYALDNHVPHGMWGGLSEMDRGFFPEEKPTRGRRRNASVAVVKCPGCGSTKSIIPKGVSSLSCVSCKSVWPAALR